MHANWKVDRTRILEAPEIAAVLTDLKRRGRRSVNSRMNLVVFRLAACCGLRASEIRGLTLDDARLGITKPYLRIRKGKGGKSRRVPLWWDRGTFDDLAAWKDECKEQGAQRTDPFVCAQADGSFGEPLTRFNIRNRFRVACRVLGSERVELLTVHDGRHSFVSHALHGGRSLAAVRDAAGHANISTTSIYAHMIDDDDDTGDLFAFGG